MADIKLKHPAATIDTQIDRVISGEVVTDNTDSVVTPDGKKPVSGEGVLKALNAGVAGLMPATPSGDPMHYAYVAAGAVWNATTGLWKLNTLTDITTEQMRKIYNFGSVRIEAGGYYGALAGVRTNLLRVGMPNPTIQSITSFAYQNKVVEVITLNTTNTYEALVMSNTFNSWFYQCSALKEIYGRLEASSSGVAFNNCFADCAKLSRVRLRRLKQDVSFADSPLLDKESLLYMINESAATSPIVITLHADVYAWASTDSDVQTALATKPNATIASA